MAKFTLAAALLCGVSLHAQSNTAGAVYGKVAGGSTVSAESMATGSVRSATASADGSYRIGALPPGTYKVTYTDSAGAPQTKEIDVSIASNTRVGTSGSDVYQMEAFVVGGMSVNPIDFGSTEAVTVFTEKQIDILPIARNPTALALLAPGTTLGDTAFGNIASFGGASVAENAYFVNGFNISNFRNGLSPATVPFEFYNQFEIKTGAYSAEFGRSTGGVINASTKSGSNDYHAGANFYYTPDFASSKSPSVYYTNNANVVVPLVYNDADYNESWQANIYASGALIKNKVFFYGLYQMRDSEARAVTTNGTQHYTSQADDPFWGAKIDIIPFANHRLEYTGFEDKSRTTGTQVGYNLATKQKLAGTPAVDFSDRGGITHIGRYTGTFFENLTISALYGKSKQNRTDSSSEDAIPFIYDGRSGSLVYVQGNPNLVVSTADDTREAMRLDAEFSFDLFGSHRLRAGLDREDNLSNDLTKYSGDLYYRYYAVPGSGQINGAAVPPGTAAVVRSRIYRNGGSFQVKSDAWYVEDNWSLMNDRLKLRLGLRSESFENLDSANKTFIKVTNQFAPRIGASYDLFGNQKTKLFANYGRYHLPVASNTNVRLAGGEFFTEKYNVLTSVGADGKNPVLGAQIGALNTYSDGSVHDRREIVDMDIQPMYQDEWVLGFQHTISKTVKVGARFTSRVIDSTAMDDLIVDHALTAWGRANGFPTFDATGAHAYVLANPGRPIKMFWDFNGNGTLEANEEALLTPAMLQYPAAQRNYYSLELMAEKLWDNKWTGQISYTWSQSYGNYEGWVLSDNGQDDAGITQMFDSPALTVNTYGKLPNDAATNSRPSAPTRSRLNCKLA
ncbi:MAG: carboxypeptidase regulatory-like domain-containing protein [Candidatus Didemnitutus sp.]|nr:carboxypeptidase regulatory-like domain-containing protein [Candidatus Didemnitutus sp.]